MNQGHPGNFGKLRRRFHVTYGFLLAKSTEKLRREWGQVLAEEEASVRYHMQHVRPERNAIFKG